MKLLILAMIAAGLAAAQTTTYPQTYDMTASALCNDKPGPTVCTYHFGFDFGIPVYWAAGAQSYYSNGSQLFFLCANPASGNWTQTVLDPVPLNTPVTFTFGCSDSTGLHNMSAAFQATRRFFKQPCGRGITCEVTKWTIDSGFLMVQ